MDNDDTPERPSEVEPIIEPSEDLEQTGLGTQKQMMKDPKWNGIPPVGNRPIDNKWKFLRLVLLVFIVKIIIWSIYRFTTGNWDVLSAPVNNYTAGIFMKPLLQLVPVFILWLYVFKEKGLPFRLTRKHLFSSIIFGCILGLVYYFVASGVFIGIMHASGQGADFHFVAGWDDAGWWLIIAMMFSYMIGTGPTEELRPWFHTGPNRACVPIMVCYTILISIICCWTSAYIHFCLSSKLHDHCLVYDRISYHGLFLFDTLPMVS